MENNNKEVTTIEELALMVAKGFDKMDEKMDKGFKDVTERLDKVESALGTIKADLNKKVDKFEHKSLEFRVEKLEKKLA